MATTIAQIQAVGDDLRRDSTSGEIDANQKLRAMVSTLEEIHSFAHWKFTTRQKRIETFWGETEYNITDVLGINDFKAVKDLRLEDDHNVRFSNVDNASFDVRHGQGDTSNEYTLEYRLGEPILRINQITGNSRTLLGNTSDHDADGTWTPDTSSSDALNITTDIKEYREGGGSINYDLDVSQSVNDYGDISVTTTSQVDLTDYEDFGTIRTNWFVPDVTNVTGSTLRWGSDSSNYWEQSTTSDVQNGSLESNWNRIEFGMNGATKTGSPDITAIDYYLFRTSYGSSQTDDTDFRLNGLRAYMPTRLELLYYSSYTAKNTSGTWIAQPTATTDSILIPDRYREVVVQGYVGNLLGQMGKFEESGRYLSRFRRNLKQMSREFGTFPKNENRSFAPKINWNY